MEELAWTGERLVTSVSDLHGTIEHLHRYALALRLAEHKTVVDIASGEGYGTKLLSNVAKKAIGIDISAEAVEHAKVKYSGTNLEFKVGSTSNIPLADNSVDLVVSFETLEHHDEHEEMMQEIKRVLTPSGVLIISSPEKSIYKARDPKNPFHIKELTLDEFKVLLSKYFSEVRLYDQKFVFGSLINELGNAKGFDFFDGGFDKITTDVEEDDFYNRPFFNLAIASNIKSHDEVPSTSIFNGLKVLHKNEENVAIENERIQKSLNIIIDQLKHSTSFKLGNFFASKVQFLKKKKQ
ncbi:MAG: class I SAM-dependent methyltransferase [Sphingobacteriaceae bacterium]|nr:MAG: class I SAM-dependent methyltransferase [Sphingobacteriaceae bacterium]